MKKPKKDATVKTQELHQQKIKQMNAKQLSVLSNFTRSITAKSKDDQIRQLTFLKLWIVQEAIELFISVIDSEQELFEFEDLHTLISIFKEVQQERHPNEQPYALRALEAWYDKEVAKGRHNRDQCHIDTDRILKKMTDMALELHHIMEDVSIMNAMEDEYRKYQIIVLSEETQGEETW